MALQHIVKCGRWRRPLFVMANVVMLIAMYCFVDLMSPFYPDDWSLDDSDIFRLIGKVWAQGGTPYVDVWDHKGPLIFFTNVIGYFIGGPLHGVFYVDLTLVLVTAFFIWRIVTLTCADCSRPVQVLTFWFTMVVLASIMAPVWDLTETVCLPFLSAALWLALRDIKASDDGATGVVVSGADGYAQGLAVSAALMTRATNAMTACVTVLVLAVILVRHARWMNLIHSAMAFIGGVLTLTVPFSVYFAVKGAFDEFIWGAFSFNMSYAAGSSGSFLSHGKLFALMLLMLPLAVTGTAVLTMLLRRAVTVESSLYLLSGAAMVIMFLHLEPFPHYVAIAVPFTPSLTVGLWYVVKGRMHVIVSSLCALLAIFIPYTAHLTILQWNPYLRTSYQNTAFERVTSQTKAEHASMVIYGTLNHNPDVMAYLRYDVNPSVRFFTLQEWQASFSADYRNRLIASFRQARSEYIVVVGDKASHTRIAPVIRSEYRKVGNYTIGGREYRLNAGGGSVKGVRTTLEVYKLR